MPMNEHDKIAHLFRRAGLGARPEEVEAWAARGLPAAVDYLVDFEKTQDNLAPEPPGLTAQEAPEDFIDNLTLWWLNAMATTTRPLQEKMVLFWHGLFATSVYNVLDARQMYLQNENFRGNFDPDRGKVLRPNPVSPFPVGNFRQILEYLTKDAAMLFYLDNVSNLKFNDEVGSNENYARELHELFSMGVQDVVAKVPNYTERDIRQASRALTGWSLLPPNNPNDTFYRVFYFYDEDHDFGPYQHLGKRGGNNADFIFNNIVRHRNPGQKQSATGRFLGYRLFKFFGYENPEPEIINVLADVFDGANGQPPYSIRNLLRTIFTPGNLVSEAFYSERAFKAHVKSPTELLVGAFRLLSPKGLSRLEPDTRFVLTNSMAKMGQYLFAPPNVAGWKEGLTWVNTSLMLARFSTANLLTTGLQPAQGGVDVPRILAQNNLKTPEQIVNYFTGLLLQAPVSVAARQVLTDYMYTPSEDPQETDFVNMKVRGLIYLIMTMPEFQLS